MTVTPLLSNLAIRRSIYALKKESTISDTRIRQLISEVIKHTPSSFNSQSTRAVLLLHKEHDKLWDIHFDVLKPVVPADGWAATEAKLNMFKGAYATVLFFIHKPTVVAQQEKFPTYAARFPDWAVQSVGAHEINLWTALAAEGMGGNLQHYNPLVDDRVRDAWKLPEDWTLDAELVIGTPAAPPREKTFLEVEGERFKVFGAEN